MIDTPIAVISGASRGALRSGRYAMRSIATLTKMQTGIAAARPTTSSTGPGVPGAIVCRPAIVAYAVSAPTISTSPCAKLIRFRMPYTIV